MADRKGWVHFRTTDALDARLRAEQARLEAETGKRVSKSLVARTVLTMALSGGEHEAALQEAVSDAVSLMQSALHRALPQFMKTVSKELQRTIRDEMGG